MPPSPWIGSTRTAAVRLSIALSSALRSLKATYLKPPGSGSKPWWYFSCAVAVTVASVRPWKPPRMLMMSPRSLEPCSLAHLRASLMAVSLASAPEFEKKTRSAKECSQRRAASCACCGMWKRLETWTRVAACSRSVPTTFGWQWPSAVTAMPPVKSRYSLPSESQTRVPSPRTRATGYRLAKVMRCLSDSSNIRFVSTLCLLPAGRPATSSWSVPVLGLKNDLGSDAFLRQDLEEDGVGHASVDDMRLLRPTPERPHRRLDLRQHAAVDHVVPDQALRLALGQRRDVLAGAVLDPLHVGEVDQLLGEQRSGHVARHEIGVDVVRLPVGADADGSDHGYEAAVLEHADRLGVDRLDLADEPDVGHRPVGLPVQPLAR